MYLCIFVCKNAAFCHLFCVFWIFHNAIHCVLEYHFKNDFLLSYLRQPPVKLMTVACQYTWQATILAVTWCDRWIVYFYWKSWIVVYYKLDMLPSTNSCGGLGFVGWSGGSECCGPWFGEHVRERGWGGHQSRRGCTGVHRCRRTCRRLTCRGC